MSAHLLSSPAVIAPISVVDAVCEAMTTDIMAGQVQPGCALPEASIATRYGVSRLTARDAIARLVAGGLLERVRNRSAVLPVLDRRALQEIAAVRGALEESSIYSRRRDPDVLDRLEAATSALRQSTDSIDRRQVWEAELSFHRDLTTLGGNARLASLHATTDAQACAAFVQAPGRPSALQIAVQHARIVRALREDDPERACGELRHHARDLVDRITRPRERAADDTTSAAMGDDSPELPTLRAL